MKKENAGFILLAFALYMQIYGDPEAADIVFTSGADITVVGINITTQLKLTGEETSSSISFLTFSISGYNLFKPSVCYLSVSDDDLLELRNSKGKHGQMLSDMCKFYRDWHVKSDGVYGKQETMISLIMFRNCSFDSKVFYCWFQECTSTTRSALWL